jgi:DNA repair protein RadC
MKTTKLYELKKSESTFENRKITTSEESAKFIRQFYSDDIEIFESSFILLLNRNNVTIGYAKISQGGVAGTVIDTKIVAKYVVDSLASSVILCHNHPSGNLNPSEADISITRKVNEVLRLLDSVLLDHVILTKDSYYSFSDNGKL